MIYILVEIDDGQPGALKFLREALHRTAMDHEIKCRDLPVTKATATDYERGVLERLFDVVLKRRIG